MFRFFPALGGVVFFFVIEPCMMHVYVGHVWYTPFVAVGLKTVDSSPKFHSCLFCWLGSLFAVVTHRVLIMCLGWDWHDEPDTCKFVFSGHIFRV